MITAHTTSEALVEERWFSLTLAEQLGNVGSDFDRALRWKAKNQPALFKGAVARMLKQLDLTLADPRWHNHRLKELARLRETICDELFGPDLNLQSAAGLQKYFLTMARRAAEDRRIASGT